jgi:triacylglycerol esterase/lipase EstA (alpha/beta hydrolase family)
MKCLITLLRPARVALAHSMICVLACGACSDYASISEREPVFRPLRSTLAPITIAQEKISLALANRSKKPAESLGMLLVAARQAADQLKVSPRDTAARDTYNYAVSRIFDHIRTSQIDPWTQPLEVPTPDGPMLFTCRPDPRPNWQPAKYDFTPADRIDLKGSYVTQRTARAGIGAPLVAKGKGMNERAKQDFSNPRIYYGVTALIHFEGKRAEASFEDPLAVEEVRYAGHTQPLAADFTVPLATMLAESEPRKIEMLRLLFPADYAETARISRLQPYDPNKTVILVIHGLMDSQATWTPMINTLRGDPEIRKNYQFWFFSYPSGYPYPYSAALLRKELDAIAKRYPTQKMALVGHSMGGCISRLMITDSGEKLWMNLFKKRPRDTHLSPHTRRLAEDALLFSHRKEVGRVIFIAAPLKGSNLAGRSIVRWASGIIRTPGNLVQAGAELLKSTSFEEGDLQLKRAPSSVDTLTPNNRFVKAINRIPIVPGIPYHTIIGDRGKGNSPDSSDGVVPYWSSHMEGAVSEKIVPSGHSAHQNPEAIAEVRRILLLHRGQADRPKSSTRD